MSEENIQTESQKDESKKHPRYEKNDNNIAIKVFWGLLLILIGGIALAGNFNLVKVQWGVLWRLWPLFIVVAGLSILAFKHVIWQIISIILSVATVAAIAWILLGGASQFGVGAMQKSNETVQVTSVDVKSLLVAVDAGASQIKISTSDQKEAVIAELNSNYSKLKQSSAIEGAVQKVNLSMIPSNGWLVDMKNEWDVKMSRALPINLTLNAGACDADIDMSEAELSTVDIDSGASSLLLSLGDNQDLANVKIDSGASSITIRIPKDSGVMLGFDDGLNSKELADLKHVDNKTYKSDNYDIATKKVNIIAKIGVSSFKIERY